MTHGVAARLARERDPLVGRAAELELLERVLDEVEPGPPRTVELRGEPGIGKTRLLSELVARAELRRHLVLSGSASELERDLPFSIFVDALDEYLGSLDVGQLSALDDDVQAELAHVFPSLSALADGRVVASQHERYRSHRAVCALLEHLARPSPLVLVLDDFHWADAASVELLGAMLRRPPTAAVLTAVALRPHQTPGRLAAALERAHRAATLERMELDALTPDEARALLGEEVDAMRAAALYRECGGNPFYLEQLARSLERAGQATARPESSLAGLEVPAAVAATLTEELAQLSDRARAVLEGAAVAGDRFEPELAAAAAATPEAATMEAVDELLELDLIRTTEVPRRFRFRHPLVRRTVYEATAAGWRLGAHERCAEALAARGVPAAGRAHHVERSAREGDAVAAAVLREAGDAAARLAPESAARWFGAALRVLPQTAPANERIELLLARALALAAAGHFADGHEALLEAVAATSEQSSALSTTVATACARMERFLGQYEQSHVRLATALGALSEEASAESVELLIELTLNEFYRSRYDAMHGWSRRAVADARKLGDEVLLAAALAMPALAGAMTGPPEHARSRCAEAATAIDALSDNELCRRPDAPSWLAAAELYLDLYRDADTHASRALALARASGRGDPFFRLYPILPRVWFVRGKLAEAADLLEGAIEAERLLGSPPALAGNFFIRSDLALAVGDLDVALATAEEGVELARRLDEGFVTAWAAVRLAAALLESGEPLRAVEVLLAGAGGEDFALIPSSWRTYCLELLTRCWLALARQADATRAVERAERWAACVQLPLAAAWSTRAAAALNLAAGDSGLAAAQALASADAIDHVGAPVESARSRILAGRALAHAGQHERAITELERAAAELDACGAHRYRDEAERELGKLGHRTYRRTRRGSGDGVGIDALSERELQVARLVVKRKTNPQIAAELFLSKKTVETHLHNIFRKIDIASRVELARMVERADRAADAPTAPR